MAEQYKAAVVGCGGAGTQHAIGYSILEGVEVVGVCDIDEAKAHALAEKVGGRPFSDCQTMYDELKLILSLYAQGNIIMRSQRLQLSRVARTFCVKRYLPPIWILPKR